MFDLEEEKIIEESKEEISELEDEISNRELIELGGNPKTSKSKELWQKAIRKVIVMNKFNMLNKNLKYDANLYGRGFSTSKLVVHENYSPKCKAHIYLYIYIYI